LIEWVCSKPNSHFIEVYRSPESLLHAKNRSEGSAESAAMVQSYDELMIDSVQKETCVVLWYAENTTSDITLS
jgi:hypothetical protein